MPLPPPRPPDPQHTARVLVALGTAGAWYTASDAAFRVGTRPSPTTVRKILTRLAKAGTIEQRHGSRPTTPGNNFRRGNYRVLEYRLPATATPEER
jgi:hypothetical protein